MKTCIIDNFDSFTFNLVDLVASLSADNNAPRVIKNNQCSADEVIAGDYDNIIISPGPGTVERAADIGICLDVIAATQKPLLGVCLGHQAIAYHHGGRKPGVIKTGTAVHGKATKIFHDGTGLFAGLANPLTVGRYHSLLVDEATLPADLRVVARDEAGNIMAIVHRTKPIHGVQFHPESILTDGGKKMMENFFTLSLSNKNPADLAKELSTASTQPTPKNKNHGQQPTKEIICRRWPTALSMADIFSNHFLAKSPAIWLDGDDKTGWGRGGFSYIGIGIGAGKKILQVADVGDGNIRGKISGDDFLAQVAAASQEFLFSDETLASLPPEVRAGNFFGGPMGFLSYEGRVLCSDAFTAAPTQSKTSAIPDGYFIRANLLVIEHKASGQKYLLAIATQQERAMMEQWLDQLMAETPGKSSSPAQPTTANNNQSTRPTITWRFDKSKNNYINNITTAIAALKQGEVYQLCLTNQLTAAVPAGEPQEAAPQPFDLYCHLRGDNNTPYRGFMSLDARDNEQAKADDTMTKPADALLCFSPEEFLQVSPHGKITTKPIKGTAKRGATKLEDDRLAQQLLSSAKNHAENIMIVDLLRNDITRVAIPGSIKVEKTCALETYDKVHQLVSTITAQLDDNRHVVDLLRASFPGGSMTGAPKIRAMQLIEQMEQRRRGVYSGIFGYVGAVNNGGGAGGSASSLAMVIRTLVVEKHKNTWRYSLGVGGGIVVDSNPADEWQELLWKAAGIIESLKKIMNVTIDEQ